GVEAEDLGQGRQLFAERHLRVDEIAGHREVPVERFARDEEPHDLRGALEDQVDPEVAHHPLDRDRRLPARAQRIRRLVAALAAQVAGSVSLPVFRVTSASFSPRPSASSRFSFGTRTSVNRMTPFSIAFNPMKWQRWTTSTPGHAFSTMKAEIFPVSGCFAM